MVEVTYRHRHEQLGLIQGENTFFQRADIKDLTGEMIKNSITKLKIFEGKEMPEIDLMIGGPSCQGFSRAGRRDKKDPRNMLFREYVRVINEIRPKYIILENVEGFMDMQFLDYIGITGQKYPDGSVTPDLLRSELSLIGYNTLEPKILNAADYGVPQRRNRVIFLGYRADMTPPKYPKPILDAEHHLTLKDAIGDLITDDEIRKTVNPKRTQYQKDSRNGRTPDINGNTIPWKKKTINNNELPNVTEIVEERFSLFLPGETGTQIKKRVMEEGIDLSMTPHLVQMCAERMGKTEEEIINLFRKGDVTKDEAEILLTKKNIRSRWREDLPSATIVSIADDYISPWENRTFSVREMARCQGFDDSFEFLGKRTTGGLLRRVEIPQYTQVGNAVPPMLAKAVAEEIKKALEQE